MPVFQVDIEKLNGTEYFSNRYFVNSDTIDNAVEYATEIASWERQYLTGLTRITKHRVSTPAEGDGTFVITNVNLTGAQSDTPLLPLFNVLRILFNKSSGRPYYKLYRGIAAESNTSNGLWDTTTLNTIQGTLFDLMVTPNGNICTEDGQAFTTVSMDPVVRMRQLRRGKRRRGISILP